MSEVKVNKISPRTNCGTVTVGDSGDSVSVTAGVPVTVNGDLKSNALKAVDGGSIISQCGTNITLGASGDTINLAAGATQTGFGRTGTVDWNTTAITADPANAVSGTGYFANTTSAAFTITLPTSPSAGDIVAVRDYAQTFATNNLTIGRNSQPIDGEAFDLILETDGAAITLVYVDGTQGWKSVNSNEIFNQATYVTATGGTVVTCGDFKTHIFTGPGTFCVSCAGSSGGSDTVDYFVVAGGGSGGSDNSGGGGAGGFRISNSYSIPAPTMSPISNPTGLPVAVTGYPIVVGGGGAPKVHADPTGNSGARGSNSIFSTITSTGGGGGGNFYPLDAYAPGGSGGGARGSCTVGLGNTPPVSPPQGNDGGTQGGQPGRGSGGGGGAGAVGSPSPPSAGGDGGAGSFISDSFIGSPAPSYGTPGPVGSTRYFAGGGGGAPDANPGLPPGGSGGVGGGGAGSYRGGPSGVAGTTNTGGGGGAGGNPNASGAGGSGIVMIRYKFQN